MAKAKRGVVFCAVIKGKAAVPDPVTAARNMLVPSERAGSLIMTTRVAADVLQRAVTSARYPDFDTLPAGAAPP